MKLSIVDCEPNILQCDSGTEFPGSSTIDAVKLQSRLNSPSQRSEIRNTLQFVVGKFDPKVMLQFGEQIKRLKAVDAEGLEKIIVGRQFFPRNFEVGCRQIENFCQRFIGCRHEF